MSGREPWFAGLRRRRETRADIRASAREKMAEAEARGRLYAAIIRGEGCCQINDPEWSREWWIAALAEYEALRAVAEAVHALVRAEDAEHKALLLMETDEDVTVSRERQRTARKVADLAFANLTDALASWAANSHSVPE